MEAISVAFEDVPLEELEAQLARIAVEERDQRFAVANQMREAFNEIPPEEIERDIVAGIREMREADEAAMRAEDQAADEQ